MSDQPSKALWPFVLGAVIFYTMAFSWNHVDALQELFDVGPGASAALMLPMVLLMIAGLSMAAKYLGGINMSEQQWEALRLLVLGTALFHVSFYASRLFPILDVSCAPALLITLLMIASLSMAAIGLYRLGRLARG